MEEGPVVPADGQGEVPWWEQPRMEWAQEERLEGPQVARRQE